VALAISAQIASASIPGRAPLGSAPFFEQLPPRPVGKTAKQRNRPFCSGRAPDFLGLPGSPGAALRNLPRRTPTRHDADWVILSACNTAAGGATNAKALSGLARAFIYAQARPLLVSHSEVYSDATVKLITTSSRDVSRPERRPMLRQSRTCELAVRLAARKLRGVAIAPLEFM
jgi:hypothetical protein